MRFFTGLYKILLILAILQGQVSLLQASDCTTTFSSLEGPHATASTIKEEEKILLELFKNSKKNKLPPKATLNKADQLLSIDPGNETACEIKLKILIKDSKYKLALETIEKFLAIHPNNIAISTQQARIEFFQGNYYAALNILSSIIEKHGEQPVLLHLKAKSLFKLHKNDNALELVEKILRKNPNKLKTLLLKSQILIMKGKTSVTKGKYKEAELLFKEALKTTEHYLTQGGDILGIKVEALMELRRYEDALKLNSEILQVNRDYEATRKKGSPTKRPRNLLNKFQYRVALEREILLFTKLNQTEKAEKALNELLIANPNDRYALARKVNFLIQQKKFPEAKKAMQKLLTIEPDNAINLTRYASLLMQLGDLDLALRTIKKAYFLRKDDIKLLYTKALILIELNKNGKKTEAIKETIQEALKLKPNDGKFLRLKQLHL